MTWKDYVEDYDSSCPGLVDVSGGSYAKKHDPLAYFTNINQANRVWLRVRLSVDFSGLVPMGSAVVRIASAISRTVECRAGKHVLAT